MWIFPEGKFLFCLFPCHMNAALFLLTHKEEDTVWLTANASWRQTRMFSATKTQLKIINANPKGKTTFCLFILQLEMPSSNLLLLNLNSEPVVKIRSAPQWRGALTQAPLTLPLPCLSVCIKVTEAVSHLWPASVSAAVSKLHQRRAGICVNGWLASCGRGTSPTSHASFDYTMTFRCIKCHPGAACSWSCLVLCKLPRGWGGATGEPTVCGWGRVCVKTATGTRGDRLWA